MGSRNSTSTTLLTLAVGTVIGVLIAPASGRETRRRLMEKSVSAKDTLQYLLMEAGDLVDQLRSVVGDLSHSTSANGKHAVPSGESRSTSDRNM